MSNDKGRYTIPTPCSNCPFRTDVPRYLRPERAQEIATSMLGDQADFTCHKTVDYDNDDGEGRVGPRGRTCAGSMILLEKEGKPTQMMRISERLGTYDPAFLDMNAPVYDTVNEWVRSYRNEDEDETPHCEVVGSSCTDAPGFLIGGAVVENMEPGQATHTCVECGQSACDECISKTEDGESICVYCAEEEGY